jgi:hypothetical protein
MAAGAAKNVLATLDSFLANAVFPKIPKNDDNFWNSAFTWIDELRNAGIYVTAALPYLLISRPLEQRRIEKVISKDLGLADDERVGAGCEATRHWLHLTQQRSVHAPPAAILQCIIDRVAFRRKGAETTCIELVTCLLNELPTCISANQAAMLSDSLIGWDEATIIETQPNHSSEFQIDARPYLRTTVAILAKALGTWKQGLHPTEPEFTGVLHWRQLCANATLPELRRAL